MTKIFSEKPLMAVFLMALAPRLAAALLLSPPLISDDIDYVAIARSLLAGGGFAIDGVPTAYRPPGYPIFLAAIFSLPGADLPLVRVVQAFMDAVSCVLAADIARRLVGNRTALATGIVAALFPLQVLYTPMAMSETVFTFLLLVVFRMYLTTEHARHAAIAGILTGIAVLFRPTAMLLPLLSLLTPEAAGRSMSRRVRVFAFALGGMLLVVAPWALRNHLEFGRAAVTSNAGVNFWMGNHPGASGSYSYPPGNPLTAIEDEFARSDAGFRLGLRFWLERPLEAAAVIPKKLAHFVGIDYWLILAQNDVPRWRSYSRAVDVYRELPVAWIVATHLPFVAVVLGAVAGCIAMGADERRRWRSAGAVILFWLLVHLVMYGGARYRLPIHPFIIMFAASGWVRYRSGDLRVTGAMITRWIVLSLPFLLAWAAELWFLLSGSPPPVL